MVYFIKYYLYYHNEIRHQGYLLITLFGDMFSSFSFKYVWHQILADWKNCFQFSHLTAPLNEGLITDSLSLILQTTIPVRYSHLCPELVQCCSGRASVALVLRSPSTRSFFAASVRWFCLELEFYLLSACFQPGPYL